MGSPYNLTTQAAIRTIKKLWNDAITVSRTQVRGELLVRVRGSDAGQGYFTEDARDAIDTAEKMHDEVMAFGGDAKAWSKADYEAKLKELEADLKAESDEA